MRAEFASALPERRETLDEAWRPLEASDWSEAGLDAAYRVVHSLAGACETFEFGDLGRVARALNDVLHAMTQAEQPPDPDARSRATALQAELLQAFTTAD